MFVKCLKNSLKALFRAFQILLSFPEGDLWSQHPPALSCRLTRGPPMLLPRFWKFLCLESLNNLFTQVSVSSSYSRSWKDSFQVLLSAPPSPRAQHPSSVFLAEPKCGSLMLVCSLLRWHRILCQQTWCCCCLIRTMGPPCKEHLVLKKLMCGPNREKHPKSPHHRAENSF